MLVPGEYRIVPVGETNDSPPDQAIKTRFGQTTGQTLSARSAQTDGARLHEVATDLFIIGNRIASQSDIGEPAALQKLLLNFLGAYEHQCFTRGVSRSNIEDSLLALSAWLDETVMQKGGDYREFWSHQTLSVKYFQNTLAGDAFFTRLEELSRDAGENELVLEVFFLCLEFGFTGRYGVEGEEPLLKIRRDLAKKIVGSTQRSARILAPEAGTPPGRVPAPKGNKKWLIVAIALLVLSLVVYGVLWSASAFTASEREFSIQQPHRPIFSECFQYETV